MVSLPGPYRQTIRLWVRSQVRQFLSLNIEFCLFHLCNDIVPDAVSGHFHQLVLNCFVGVWCVALGLSKVLSKGICFCPKSDNFHKVRGSTTFLLVSMTRCSSLVKTVLIDWDGFSYQSMNKLILVMEERKMAVLRSMSRCLLEELSTGLEWLSHQLTKILPSNLFWCEKCTGSTVCTIIVLTIIKPGVLPRPRWLKLRMIWITIWSTCTWVGWCIIIRLRGQDTMLVFPAKFIQAHLVPAKVFQCHSFAGTFFRHRKWC